MTGRPNTEIDPYERSERYVRTSLGCIRGRRRETVYNDFYYSFERIPYALPPLGSLRFREPVPMKPWCILMDCTYKAQKPIQYNVTKGIAEGTEDCLYLNVYVKHFASETPLPIMVFLYGGGFKRGDPTSTQHGPDYFMSREVILVTIAYRLGPFGFLSFKDKDVACPGNAGLKDQLLGLQWVKANAKTFRGDPNNITLFGSSAGAACIHYLMMTAKAKGLFHKVILQSGTALCPWALCTLDCLPHRLAKALGYNGPMKDDLVMRFLQKSNAEHLVRANLLTEEEINQGHLFSFGPVVEPYRSENCIIPYTPEILITKAWGHCIPMLIGGTSFEGLLMKEQIKLCHRIWVDNFEKNPKILLPKFLISKFSDKKLNELAKILKETHFESSENSSDVLTICKFLSYKLFWHPIHRTILSRQWYSNCPTYVYRFDFDSSFYNLYRTRHTDEPKGVAHCDDLGYLFHGMNSRKLDTNSCEYKTIRNMIAIWTRFAKKSNPSCRMQQKGHWLPIEKEEDQPIYCLNISREMKIVELPEHQKLRVWNDLYKESFTYDDY